MHCCVITYVAVDDNSNRISVLTRVIEIDFTQFQGLIHLKLMRFNMRLDYNLS